MTECQTHYTCTVAAPAELAELSESEREQLADELLQKSIEQMGHNQEYPFYSPAWLRCLSQADANLPLAESEPHEYALGLREAGERLLDHTPMLPRYERAFRLRLQGLTYREVGERLRVSLDTARRWTIKATARLAEAAVGLDQLLTEEEMIWAVFYAESNRHSYHSPRHCKLGQEACSKTGKCTRRWYLMYELGDLLSD